MDLNNEFRVGVPPSVAWTVLTDVERIAPCMPGAQLQEIEGDEFRGIVKVKVGPITAQYKGKATFLERDESGGRLVLRAEGRDTRGQGNANATITATLAPDGDGTAVRVLTDLTVTGKVAQFGRGVLAEVSAKLLNQFVACLERDVLAAGHAGPASSGPEGSAAAPSSGAEEPASNAAGAVAPEMLGSVPAETAGPASSPVAEAAAPAATAGAVAPEMLGSVAAGTAEPPSNPVTKAPDPRAPVAGQGGGPNGSSPEAPERPVVRRVEHREATPVDLIDAAGGSVIKRAAPALAAIAVLLAFVGWRRRRSRRR